MDHLSLGSSYPSEKDLAIGDERTPQLVYQSVTTAIYRLQETGFKVILDRNSSEEQIIRKLLQEQNISSFLPSSCRKRQVTDITSYNRRPALIFKWNSGITLKEWIQNVQFGPQVDLNIRLRAAMAIAKTVSDFHDGGVVYNSLTPENIILTPVGGDCVATLIDLSSALIYKDGNRINVDAAFERRLKDMELKSLGLVLNKMLGGDESTCGGGAELGRQMDPDSYRRKRGKQHTMGGGLPLYLASLISTLLKGKDDTTSSEPCCYESAKDVYLDLKVMAESNSNNSLRKYNLDGSAIASRLRLHEGMFYGRQVQLSMLLHLFQSSVVLGNQPLMAMISGSSGSGKSTLANQIKKPLADKDGYFIEGKFDKAARPDAVLSSALNSFFGKLIEANAGNTHQSMKWRIRDSIGVGSGSNDVLLQSIPNLQKWLAEAEDNVRTENPLVPSEKKGMRSSVRLKFMFCTIIGAIACMNHPVILFMDDLQWADEMTLDVIRMMMIDPDIHHFLFLGSYRENEVSSSHPLINMLDAIKAQGASIVTIKVGQIARESVNTLLSETLFIPPSLCKPLSTVVHNKTCGIIMFIWKFLAYLNDEGLLWFSMTHRRWLYDLNRIRLEKIHQDVVSHMTEHMTRHLPNRMQMGLKFAAFLGPRFDAKILEMVMNENENHNHFLEFCVENGWLVKRGSNQYAWAHDQIQQAAYDLVPLPKRESFHLLIGCRILIKATPSEIKDMIFSVVDLLNHGWKLIQDKDQRHEAALLNLQAGEKALAASTFRSAANYFMSGISLLEDDSWEANYSLTIRLHDAASEALFVTGDFSTLSSVINSPLVNAHSFEDKLNAYNNLVRALAASSKYDEGITECLNILAQLGEVIPTDITADVYRDEVIRVKQLMDGKSRTELLSLPLMLETKKLAAIQFMNHALIMAYNAKPMLSPILVFRMVRLSILHGICNISCFAFGCYGGWLVSEPSWDVEGGHSMGRVATEMMNKLGAVEMTPRVYATVYGFINIWKEPWQACLSKHLEAYESGASTGDIEYAITNLYQHINTAAFGCGENLERLSQNSQACAKRAFQHNQMTLWKSSVIHDQFALDLMGIEKNAFSPYISGVTEESCFARAHDNNEIAVCRLIYMKKKYVAFFTGDLDGAAKFYELSQEYSMSSVGRQTPVLVTIFIDGLIAFFFARKHRKDDEVKWTDIGFGVMESLKKWATNSDWNFSNKMFLLEAEYYFLMEDHTRAMYCYNASIAAARDHRFIHEEGLAEEKLATYLLHKSNPDEALGHFNNAKKCYEVWGAHTLVQHVEKAIAVLNR